MKYSPTADSIGHEIKAVNHLMQRKMLLSASKSGVDKITVMHGWIINYLNENAEKDIFQKDIESKFSISRSTVTNILKLMEKKGYITRKTVDSDARLKKIELTENGAEIGNILKSVVIENEIYFNNLLDDDEKENFLFLIEKLRNKLENN